MSLTRMLNECSDAWGPLMIGSLFDAWLVLIVVGMVWLALRRWMSPQLTYWLFLLVPITLAVPVELPAPGWVLQASPRHFVEQIVARATLRPADHSTPGTVPSLSHGPIVSKTPTTEQWSSYTQRAGEKRKRPEGPAPLSPSTTPVVSGSVTSQQLTPRDESSPLLSTQAKWMLAWFAVVLIMLTYFLHSQWRFLRVTRGAEPLDPQGLPVDFGLLKRLAGVKGSIRLRVGPTVTAPVVHGLVRPTLLISRNLAGSMSPAQLRFVLLHELAHVGRRDLWVVAFQRIVQMLYFFNPAVWIANWMIDRQREYACDDVALATGQTTRRKSGEAFLKIVEQANSRKPSLDSALGIFSSKRFFRSRLMRILDADRRVHPKLTLGSVAFFVSMAMFLVPHVRAVDERSEDTEPVITDVTSSPNNSELEAAEGDPGEIRDVSVSAFGRVVDADGRPMQNVTVHLRDWPTERVESGTPALRQSDILATARSDQDGTFRFQDVRVPPFRLLREPFDLYSDVVAVSEGYALSWEHLLTMTATRKPLTLTMVPESQVSGHIVDEQGQPVEGAVVKAAYVAPLGSDDVQPIRDAHLSLLLSDLAPTGVTDSNGRVLIDGLPPDTWIVLAVHHDDHKDRYVHVATTDEPQPDVRFSTGPGSSARSYRNVHDQHFSLAMEPGGPRLSGRVTFADSGKPCANALVYLSGTGVNLAERTDEDGRYIFEDTLITECRLTVISPEQTDYLSPAIHLTLPADGSDTRHDFELPIGHIVSGSVRDEDTDEGIAGVSVLNAPLWGKEPDGYLGRRATTDDGGNFTVAVPLGKSILCVRSSESDYVIPWAGLPHETRDARFVRIIDVTNDNVPDNVHFWLSRGLVIEGVVTDADGQPVGGATVKSVRREYRRDSYREKETRTNADGRFALSGFPVESQQYLDVTHEGRGLYGKVTVEAEERALSPRVVAVNVTLTPAAVIKGQVLLDGEPASGIRIRLLRFFGRRDTRSAILAQTASDAKGNYTFNVVPTDDRLQLAAGTSYQAFEITEYESDEFVLEAEQLYEAPTITIRRRDATISGIVVDPNDNPIAGVFVSAHSTGEDEFASSSPGPTGPSGRFMIRAVTNGPLTLLVRKKNPPDNSGRVEWSQARVTAQGGDPDARIVLGSDP